VPIVSGDEAPPQPLQYVAPGGADAGTRRSNPDACKMSNQARGSGKHVSTTVFRSVLLADRALDFLQLGAALPAAVSGRGALQPARRQFAIDEMQQLVATGCRSFRLLMNHFLSRTMARAEIRRRGRTDSEYGSDLG